MNESDEQLYESFLHRGNEEALLVLIKRHREGLVLFINGFVHNMDTAGDLALDAFAEIAAGPSLFAGKSSFKTWLFSIGRNLALMHQRKALKKDTFIESIDGAHSPELDILKDERNRTLYEGLSRINEDYRRILILLFFEEMTHEEAAYVMGKNRRQIYHLVECGKKALKEQLLNMGFEYEIGQ